MARKEKAPDAGPSKAYLVSFGDTMTALLAFFIVLNSLAKEQTGANMYNGTGSFVTAFAKSGTPGGMTGNRSRDMIQQTQQSSVYALAGNLDKNVDPDNVGPDEDGHRERIADRDKEQFQKFLAEIEKKFGLNSEPPIRNQVVFDSFSSFNRKTGSLSPHALQLASETIPKLRKGDTKLEIVLWATMPSKRIIDKTLEKSLLVKKQIEESYWLKPQEKQKIRYTVKPWLFSDAKRPIISFVISEQAPK